MRGRAFFIRPRIALSDGRTSDSPYCEIGTRGGPAGSVVTVFGAGVPMSMVSGPVGNSATDFGPGGVVSVP